MHDPFEHIAELNITTERTSWCPLPGLLAHRFPDADAPEIQLRYAGEEHAAYWNAFIAATSVNYGDALAAAVKQSNGEVNDGMRKAARAMFEESQRERAADRDLYPEHIVVGWRNMLDASGAAIAFTAELGRSLISKLPAPYFQMLRNHARNRGNFGPPKRKLEPAAKEAVLGNSESASPGS